MGKHSSKNPFGADRPRHSAADARRVPAERRRTPGENSASAGAHGSGESYQLSDPNTRHRGSLEAAPARLRVERDRRRSRAKRIALIVGGATLGLLAVAALAAFFFAKNIEATMHGTIVEQQKIVNALTAAKPMEPFNLLILGADYRTGDTQYRSDSMIVAHIDPKLQKVWLLSIPRDTRAEIPGHGTQKINAAHFFNGPEGAIKATESLTGLKINHYLEMNFAGFKSAVDALGGVWINVPVTIDDKAADNSRGDVASHIDAGYQRLDGPHALTFVRARHQFVDQDFSRMKNQQLFFKALANQIAKSSSVAKLPRVVSSVAPYIRTDMSLIDMIKVAQSLKAAGGKNLYSATIKGEWKSPYIYPDQTLLAKLVADVNAERPFEATATAGLASGAPIARNPATVSVTVHNGSGIAGAAKQAAEVLKAKNFNVSQVGNANQNVYKNTLIIYKTDMAAAQLLATVMPPGCKIVQSRGMYSFTTTVLVVVGSDWDAAKIPATAVLTQ